MITPRLLRGTRFPSLGMLLFLFSLLAIGTIFVHSASTAGEVPFPGPLARAHLMRIGIGLVLLFGALAVDYRRFDDWAFPLYLLGLASLLVLVVLKFIRHDPTGASRWIRIFGITQQPSEYVKLFTILMLARVLKPGRSAASGPNHLRPILVTALPCALVALQPDLGTALVLPPLLLAMLWVSGVSGRRLMAYIGLGIALLPVAWMSLHSYQRDRLLVFLHPSDPKLVMKEGYQVHQSMIALGSGGVTGKGLYLGTQNYLEMLPEDHNDFIFAIIGEEWGLAGTLTVVALYVLLYLSALGVAYRTREPFGRLVAAGIAVQLGFQTAVNLAMTMGLAPVTGLPLPFVSYGGSSMLSSLLSMGVVLSIGMRPVRIVAPDGLRSGIPPASLRTFMPRRSARAIP